MAKTSKTPSPLAALPAHIRTVADAAQSKKALGLTVLDLRAGGAFADFFVICSGQTTRQVKAIVDAIEEALVKDGLRPSHVEGYQRGDWVLIDCFDFIVHVFTPQMRAFYGLERLWGEAVEIDLSEDGGTGSREAAPKPPTAAKKTRRTARP